jgi:hypothetical protein
MKSKLIIGAILLLVVGFYSCQKSDRSGTTPSLATTLSASVAEVVGNQVSALNGVTEHSLSLESFDGHGDANVLGTFGMGGSGIPNYGFGGIGRFKFGIPHIDSCAIVTVSSVTYPKEITIEYTGTCNEHHGHINKGKIIIDISDSLKLAGAVETITYQDFYMDSMKIDLTASIKNLGQNADGNWVIEKNYSQTITRGDFVCVRENKESQEWTAGFGTRDKSDDVYYLSGNGSVSINDTVTYTKTITIPLLFDSSCEFISKGVVELTRNGSTATIDYGDGTCDNKATVTIDGTTEEISLHSFRFHEGGHFEKHFHGFGKRG